MRAKVKVVDNGAYYTYVAEVTEAHTANFCYIGGKNNKSLDDKVSGIVSGLVITFNDQKNTMIGIQIEDITYAEELLLDKLLEQGYVDLSKFTGNYLATEEQTIKKVKESGKYRVVNK